MDIFINADKSPARLQVKATGSPLTALRVKRGAVEPLSVTALPPDSSPSKLTQADAKTTSFRLRSCIRYAINILYTQVCRTVMKNAIRTIYKRIPSGLICLAVIIGVFGSIGSQMGVSHMLNSIMKTAHDLLLNTVFYLMAICVLTGAMGKLFVEFGVVRLLEHMLRPLMRPLYNLPGVAALGAVITFLSDNPAIISLAQDKRFASYFRKYEFISITNFGTSFGMGLIVIVFMVGQGYYAAPFIGLFAAFCASIISTRLMQFFILRRYPEYANQPAIVSAPEPRTPQSAIPAPLFQRVLDSLLDGGRAGVSVGMSIIPGVLIISTLVMLLTFGPSANGQYTGAAYEGVEFLPWLGAKCGLVFEWLFGFQNPHLIAFPITALGAVGAALALIPGFEASGWLDGNAVAVLTAFGACWSGYLSTHTAMLDTLGYRRLTHYAIRAHAISGIAAGIIAHWLYVLYSMI